MASRFFGALLLYGAVFTFAQTTPELRISQLMVELNTTLEELAKSSILQARDPYFVNELFLSMIRQNPSIRVITRVDSAGTIVNLVTGGGVVGTARNIAAERWFSALSKTRKSYAGISRDSFGSVFLFRAWPLLKSAGPENRFGGAFSVKIDLRNYLRSALNGEIVPVQVLFNDTPLFRQNWKRGEKYREELLNLTENDRLVIRSRRSAAAAGVPAETPAAAARPAQVKEAAVPDPAPAAEPVKRAVSAPRSLQRQGEKGWGLIAGAVVAAAVLAAFAVFLKPGRKRGERKPSDLQRSLEPLGKPMFDAERRDEPLQETKELAAGSPPEPLSATALVERETKEFSASKEYLADASRQLRQLTVSSSADERGRLMQEIRTCLSMWVASDLQELAAGLETLLRSVNMCAKNTGEAPDVQVLRREIERIITVVRNFDQRMSLGNGGR